MKEHFLIIGILFFILSIIELFTICRDKEEVWFGAYLGFVGFMIMSIMAFVYYLE